MRKTPLHGQHQRLGARMGGFGGWDMPIQYAGILQEHVHTRTKVSVFDICHMGEFYVSGPNACSDLERLLTCRIPTLNVGQVRYGFMLDACGRTLDDLTCYRMAEDRYMLVVNAGTLQKDADWIVSNLSKSTRFEDASNRLAKLDIQGPKTRLALESALSGPMPDLGYFRFREHQMGGYSFIVSRTGYTGEFGYELYLPVDEVEKLWCQLLEHPLIEPAGLGARDTLRLEMGYPLYGHELSESRTPVATSRGAFIDLEKDFIGRDAVSREIESPPALLVGLKFDSKRAAREHDKVYADGRLIGEVSSGSLAPSLEVAVAMAFVDSSFSDLGRMLEVEIRGKLHPAQVVDLPFYKGGSARN